MSNEGYRHDRSFQGFVPVPARSSLDVVLHLIAVRKAVDLDHRATFSIHGGREFHSLPLEGVDSSSQ